jgi:putative ABC transport system permease protein
MTREIGVAARMLANRPGLLLVAVLSLALGIGINVAVFSVIHGALLRPLPYRDAERITVVWHTFGKGQSLPALHPMDYRDYKARNKLFDDFTLVGGFETMFQANEDPELVRVGNVAANFFPFLGVEPAAGRHFTEAEDLPGGPRVVWIDHDLWQRHFGLDPGVIGRTVHLDGIAHEIVGIVPKRFELYLPQEAFFVKRPQLWKPARIDFARLPPRNWTAWTALGRIRDGVALADAEKEMALMGADLRREVPEFEAGDLRVSLVPLDRDVVKGVSGGLWSLMGAVAFVLLIACANVARLLLARGFSREAEFRMRAALGASKMQLARSVLSEGLVIAAAGAFLGVMIAQWGLQVIRTMQAAAIPRIESVRLDLPVLLFAVAATIVATVLSAIVPGLRAAGAVASPGPASDLRTSGTHRRRLQDRLVIGQVALAVMVVVGTGLMIQSFRALVELSPGFEPRGLLTMRIALPKPAYANSAAIRDFYRQLEERVLALPGVTAMGATSLLPLAGAGPLQTFAYDEETARNWESATADYRRISPGFFRAMGGTLLAGREFDERDIDAPGAPRRIIIDTALARRAFPDRNAVGERLQVEPEGPSAFAEIVGVVAPLSLQGIKGSPMPQLYEADIYSRLRASLLIRSTTPPEDLAAAVRRELLELSPGIAIQDVRSMDDIMEEALAPTRLAAALMSVFGMVSVALAGLGLYSALAYSVSQRTRELGIRIALGETPWSLKARVLSQGLRLVAISLVIGALSAIAVTATTQASFYGVHFADPRAYMGAALLLVTVAVAACWIPASRAARIDPLRALRHD